MTEPQRWKRDMWAGRLAMLCYVVVNYAETWRVGLLPRAVSTALFLVAAALYAVLVLAGRAGFWWRRYSPLLTTAEKARMIALGPLRSTYILLAIFVALGCLPVYALRDVLGQTVRQGLVIGLSVGAVAWFILNVRLKTAEWRIYERVARDM